MQTHTNIKYKYLSAKTQIAGRQWQSEWTIGSGGLVWSEQELLSVFLGVVGWVPSPTFCPPINIHIIIVVMMVKTMMALFVSSARKHSTDHSQHIFQTNLFSTSSTFLESISNTSMGTKLASHLKPFLQFNRAEMHFELVHQGHLV